MSNDRIAAFLNAASEGGISLSEGSVYSFCKKFAGNAQESISKGVKLFSEEATAGYEKRHHGLIEEGRM